MTIAVWSLDTVPALTAKLAALEPAATVTDDGTVSAAALLDSATVTPFEPAKLDSVTAHADVAPDVTLVGAQDS